MKSILISIISILLLLTLWGCSAEDNNSLPTEISELENLTKISADIQPTHDITIQKDIVFGDSEMIGRIRDIAADDSGRVYLADTQQKTIHVFSSDGQLIKRLGRNGIGPGEFGHISVMKIQGNKLFAFDPTLFRVNFYSLESLTFDHAEGLFVQDWANYPNIRKASPIKFYDWGDKNLLIGFNQIMGTHIYYYLVNNSNHSTDIISDPILVQKNDKQARLDVEIADGVMSSTEVPFGRESLMTVSKDRHIFSAWNDMFLIKEYDPEGMYLRALYYPYNNLPLTQANLDSIASSRGGFEMSIQKAFNENDIPATWPALDDMRIDENNRLWISTVDRDPSLTKWWVLEMDGTLLAWFTWPRNKPIAEVKGDYLYTLETNVETGLQSVVRYLIMVD